MYGLYTFGLVLVLAPPGEVASEAEQRGLQILTGIALLAIGLVIAHAASVWLAKHHPQPELPSAPPETPAELKFAGAPQSSWLTSQPRGRQPTTAR